MCTKKIFAYTTFSNINKFCYCNLHPIQKQDINFSFELNVSQEKTIKRKSNFKFVLLLL